MDSEDTIFIGPGEEENGRQGDVVFYIGGEEKVRISSRGMYVDGALIENDHELYVGFLDFLRKVYKYHEDEFKVE